MSNAIKIYQDILFDLHKSNTLSVSVLNRSILLKNKIRIVFAITIANEQRMIAVMLPDGCKKESINRFPKWHGIEFTYGYISEYKNQNGENEYIIITQSKDYDSGIFEIIANDITNQLESLTVPNQMMSRLIDILGKWKKFFLLNSEVIMSEEMQEGLYGELMVLNKLILTYGEESILLWSGADRETHDFYIKGNAIEVKTTASKSAEKIKISSENQLNPNDIENTLFLYVNKVRKSYSDGERLPDIINHIESLLSANYKDIFTEKLFQYGYIHGCEEKYTIGFHMRSKQIYTVKDDFPNIIPEDLDNGISEVVYSLDLNACINFVVTWDTMIDILGQGG